jgi:hypothetical protein
MYVTTHRCLPRLVMFKNSAKQIFTTPIAVRLLYLIAFFMLLNATENAILMVQSFTEYVSQQRCLSAFMCVH